MKEPSKIQMTDGSYITRPNAGAPWKPLPASGKLLTGSMAIGAARAQNKAVAKWHSKSIEEYRARKKP